MLELEDCDDGDEDDGWCLGEMTVSSQLQVVVQSFPNRHR